MADNQHTLADDQGTWSDWIELYNPGASAVSLDGWTITDTLDDPERAPLDGLSVEAGGFLLLWADGDSDLGAVHLSFRLDEDGEALGLFGPGGAPVDGLRFGEQASDISLGREPDGGDTWILSANATPGASNGGGS